MNVALSFLKSSLTKLKRDLHECGLIDDLVLGLVVLIIPVGDSDLILYKFLFAYNELLGSQVRQASY